MLIDFLRWLSGLVVTLAAILFAVANRAPIAINWSPLNPPAQVPVYVVALGGIVIGLFLGAFFLWLNTGTLRREHRRQRRQIDKLQQQLDEPGRGIDDE